ncbi:uncharacterized protein N7496_000990 [Penicillium cataractarum]|uniref:T6SS Phospholipase effector Tle1-like catalytic domain-containing protein n=1 Tax=Penicillium cataractarum TaxID=2100454 RepID=A0A9W9VV14_9EURO|nr:uncharacterized protein N7496_000990 [Penicillium cataractarum]KAJ5389922.1 hypothetical protein N7496_000990 [Penicillium cataractarum]
MPPQGKRLVVCLDGTWVNSDQGYNRPTVHDPNYTLQVPSNVTRLYRALRKKGLDGMSQVVYYHPGVGSSGSLSDEIAGGVFGAGVGENIREAYSFIATNYEPGDEIMLIGFSRGAFTARSVAGLITEIGLLTSRGMEYLYPIFKDTENFRNLDYKDKFPTIPFPNKPLDQREYKLRLEDVCVPLRDSPAFMILMVTASRSAASQSLKQLEVWAFQIQIYPIRSKFLAPPKNKYEVRTSFAPAVWERPRGVHTDLRQVWFCGAHSNVGGGLPDQELANVSMAWMMDQLADLGVSFEEDTIDRIFRESVLYYYDQDQDGRQTNDSPKHDRWKQWAVDSIYEEHRPVRPWGLGEMIQPDIGFYKLAGKTTRTPGMYRRTDPDTALPTREYLEHTNERIHRSVRIRLALEGLNYDDVGLYKCRALLRKGPWLLQKARVRTRREIRDRDSYGDEEDDIQFKEEYRWEWVYDGPPEETPASVIMPEEALGPYEKKLLGMNKGTSLSVGRPFYRAILRENRR